MAPIAIDPAIKDVAQPIKDTLGLPPQTRKRLEKAGIDLSQGYPYRPARPLYLDDAFNIRNEPWRHDDAGARADKSKSSLLSAATSVTDLTKHIGSEIAGIQLKDLSDQQKDELALLIAERSVVFFRDQDLSPQQQKSLGEYYGKVEIHPQVPQVPGVEGVTVIWPALQATEKPANFRNPGGASRWHTDLVHERQPAGITHLHNVCAMSRGFCFLTNPDSGPNSRHWRRYPLGKWIRCVREAFARVSTNHRWAKGHIPVCSYLHRPQRSSCRTKAH